MGDETTKGPLVKLTLMLPPELYDKIRTLAGDTGLPMGVLVGEILNTACDGAADLKANMPDRGDKLLN